MTKQTRRLDLDLMRGLAIIAVITIHCMAQVLKLREVGSIAWVIGDVIDSAVRWAVPLFVMISGGLLIKKSTYLNIGEFYRKRLRRLGLPLIAWPIIYFVWYLSTGRLATVSDFFHAYILGKPVGGYHLYFLFLIAGLYAIAPILSAFVSVVSQRQVWVTCCAILTVTTASFHLNQLLKVPISYNAFSYFIPYVGYFLLGYLLINFKTRMPHQLILSSLASLITIVAISLLTYLTRAAGAGSPFYEYSSLTVIILSVSVFFLIQSVSNGLERVSNKLTQFVRSLSYCSFGIYLIHIIFLEDTIRLLKLDKASITTTVLLIPTTLLLSWIVVAILRKTRITRLLVE